MTTKPSAAIECDHQDSVPPHGIFDEVLLVSVGDEYDKKEYRIHCGLFSHHAPRVYHVLEMGPNYRLNMKNSDPDIFDTVVYWMYTGRFWNPKSSKGSQIPLSVNYVLEVYFFAIEESFEFLPRDALDLLYRLTLQDWKALISEAYTIYHHDYATARLQRFLLDFAVNVLGFDLESHPNTAFPKPFLEHGLRKLKQLQKAPGMPGDFDKTFADWIVEKNETFCRDHHGHDYEEDDSKYISGFDAEPIEAEDYGIRDELWSCMATCGGEDIAARLRGITESDDEEDGEDEEDDDKYCDI